GLAADEVRDHLAEVDLPQPGSAEAVAGRGAEHDPGRGLVAQRQLAGHERTEIAVVLETPRDVGQELRLEIGLQVGIDADIVAVRAGLVRGREPGEHLRPARRVAPERVEMPAVDPGRALSLLDGGLLPAYGDPR